MASRRPSPEQKWQLLKDESFNVNTTVFARKWLRIRFYAHLQRARLRCIAWTSPKKNKYYANVKFFMKHYSNATSLKPRYFRQGPFTSLWLVLVLALQVVFCSKVSSSAVASLPRNKHFHTHIIW